MSNILIIKHGSLGDLIQANGAIKDIKENFSNDKVFLLTTPPYAEFMSSCPYIDGVIIDKRLPRWNLFYLRNLRRTFERFSFEKVFDLQNSSRTDFYKSFLFKKSIFWSNKKSFASQNEVKIEKDFPVLDRINNQLNRAGLKNIIFTKKIDLNWATKNVKNIINRNFEGNYILIFPFCSPKLPKKKWPYYESLIKLLKRDYGEKYNLAIAPGPKEIEEAKKFNINIILNKSNSINIIELISLIKGSSYVVSNDTGPAHICSHLNVKGLALFGSHTTPEKVSMESENFQSIKVDNLKNLNVSDVFEKIKENLS